MPTVRLDSPASPIGYAEQRDFMRLATDDEQPLVEELLLAASAWLTRETNVALLDTAHRLELARFPRCREIELWPVPLASVASVVYDDADGVEQSLDAAAYTVDYARLPARLVLKRGQSWPATAGEPGSVRITYSSGHGTADRVPAELRAAVRLMAAHLFENREPAAPVAMSEVPMALQRIVELHRFPNPDPEPED